MFIAVAVIATFFYALNAVFLTPLARRMNPLNLCALRGISLGVTMAPLLYFVPAGTFNQLNAAIFGYMALTASVSTVGNVCMFNSQRYLPVGISLALRLSFAAIFTTIFGIVFNGDILTKAQLGIGALILVETSVLGLVSRKAALETFNLKLGILYCLGFGLFLGIGYSTVSIVSARISPLLVGYMWEFGTGLMGMLVLYTLKLCRQSAVAFSFKDLLNVAVAASPTVVGSSCYAMATTMGPLGILGAVLSTIGAMGAILGYLILKERLSKAQCVMIGVIVMTLIALKFTLE